MVRGNQYLEFETDQSIENNAWPRRQGRRVPHHAGQNNDPMPAVILVIIAVMSILFTVDAVSRRGQAPNVAQQPEVRHNQASAGLPGRLETEHGDRLNNEVTMAPQVLFKPAPTYSEAARVAKYQGTVLLQILIDESGRVADIKVIRPLGLGLDEEAIKAVLLWRFRPATKNGIPVAKWVVVEVNFRLL